MGQDEVIQLTPIKRTSMRLIHFVLAHQNATDRRPSSDYFFSAVLFPETDHCVELETAAEVTDGLTFDPYNSYCFWREEGSVMGSALRRKGDLCDVGRPRTLMMGDDLGPFSVNYREFSLLVPDKDPNELYLVDVEEGTRK